MNKAEELIKLFIPEEVVKNFEIVRVVNTEDEIKIYVDEKAIAPKLTGDNQGKAIRSKGYSKPVEIQDFGIRGKKCLYVIRRKKWKIVGESGVITRDIQITKAKTNLTKEFAAFLKMYSRT